MCQGCLREEKAKFGLLHFGGGGGGHSHIEAYWGCAAGTGFSLVQEPTNGCKFLPENLRMGCVISTKTYGWVFVSMISFRMGWFSCPENIICSKFN